MNWLGKNWSKLLTGVIVLVVGMRLLDLMMLWKIFSFFASSFRGLGLTNDYLVNAISVAMMTVAALLLRHLILKFILHRTEEGTIIFGVVVTGWMLLMYFLSVPKNGEYFNPVTGEPRYVFTLLANGEIDLKPLGYKYHPVTGEEMRPFTQKEAKQYAGKIYRQSSALPLPPQVPTPPTKEQLEYPKFLTRPQVSRSANIPLDDEGRIVPQECARMRVKSVWLKEDHVRLILAFENICGNTPLPLTTPSGEDVYLVSDTGEALRLTTHHEGAFPKFGYLGPIFFSKKIHFRELVPHENWELHTWFPPLTKPAKKLTLTYKRFDRVTITLL